MNPKSNNDAAWMLLRANAALRDEYANVKAASAQQNLTDGLAYGQDKEPFILKVLTTRL